jgi:ATP-dependent Lon protease
LQYITTRYTREAGVRSLERQIGSVIRYKAVQWADTHDPPEPSDMTRPATFRKRVDAGDVSEILGVEWWNPEERDSVGRRGVVNGLVVQGEGEGSLLSIETLLVPGTGHLRATGSLGGMLCFSTMFNLCSMATTFVAVIKESGDLALSWVRLRVHSSRELELMSCVKVKANAYNLGITSSPSEDPLLVPDSIDIHLHLPSGAQKKDGVCHSFCAILHPHDLD